METWSVGLWSFHRLFLVKIIKKWLKIASSAQLIPPTVQYHWKQRGLWVLGNLNAPSISGWSVIRSYRGNLVSLRCLPRPDPPEQKEDGLPLRQVKDKAGYFQRNPHWADSPRKQQIDRISIEKSANSAGALRILEPFQARAIKAQVKFSGGGLLLSFSSIDVYSVHWRHRIGQNWNSSPRGKWNR